jgi:hypothetical protein
MTVFGDGASPQEVTYQTIATQIRSMVPRALTANTLDDVITLVEFMRDETIRRHDANEARSVALDEREKALNKRARDLALHERAVAAVLKPNGSRRLGRLWG